MFRGPVFIIGMPRSGTKLLRALLIEHSKIGIPLIETEFFPYLVNLCKEMNAIHSKDRFDRLYYRITKYPYFIYTKDSGRLIEKDIWYQECRDFSASGLFESLIRHDACVPWGSDMIWGDKSPSYITKTKLLKEHFPQARFVHIVRDARDYCLSMNKMWGKNMVRAAVRWNQSIQKLHKDMQRASESYLEIRYEDLLDSPKDTLNQVCSFLGLEYDDEMLKLTSAPESAGNTKGKKEIVRSNKQKYKEQLSIDLLRNIEAVTANILKVYGYPTEHESCEIRISPLRIKFYQIQDAVNLIRYDRDRKGILKKIKFYVRYFKVTRS